MHSLQSLRKAAGDARRDRYPKFRQQLIQEHVFTKESDAPLEIRIEQGDGVMRS